MTIDKRIEWLARRVAERLGNVEPTKKKSTPPKSFTGIIYKYTNKVNGMMYIGQTMHARNRRKYHKNGFNSFPEYPFYKAINKYGWENFDYEILYKKHYLTREDAEFDLNLWEVHYISLYDSYIHGYNQDRGGTCHLGHSPSEKTRQIMRERFSGEKNPFFGKTHTEETRAILRGKQKGKTLSIETRRKISEKTRGENNPRWGVKASPETRFKISEALKVKAKSGWKPNLGKHLSEEARRKISEKTKGRKDSIETRRKKSESHKGEKSSTYGKHLSEETRKKISERNKRPILQFDLSGNFIREWDGVIDASRALNIKSTNICCVCRGKARQASGFIWSYKN